MSARPRRAREAVLLTGLLLLVGCGSGSQDGPPGVSGLDAPTASATAYGARYGCDTVWQVGQVLPADYDGSCLRNGGLFVGSLNSCSDGTPYAEYRRFYARVGETVGQRPADDAAAAADPQAADYQAFLQRCLG